MNNFFKIAAIFVLVLSLSAGLTACVESAAENKADNTSSKADSPSSDNGSYEQTNDKFFYAEVISLETDFGGILVKPEEPMLSGELIVHAKNLPEVSVGDRVKVAHDGQIALSYPGQVFGAEVTIAE